MKKNSVVTPPLFKLKDLQEFKDFEKENFGKDLDEIQTIIMFGRAIHWLSILEILWPNFEQNDYYSVEVKNIIYNDPQKQLLPNEFYIQIAEMLYIFWMTKLERLYPEGKWEVKIHNDPEMTVDATIIQR